MKQCPMCHKTYTDPTLRFCLTDGTPLEENEEETIVFSHSSGRGHTNAPSVPSTTAYSIPASATIPSKQGISTVLMGIIATLLLVIVVLGGFVVLTYMSGRGNAGTSVAIATPSPSKSVMPDDETEKLKSQVANLQKQMEQQKTIKPVATPQSLQAPTGETVAWANSPGDGFLALRSEPNSETGSRITKIPHGAQISIGSCREYIFTARGNRGRWCTASYNGYSGWVFDAFVRY